MFEHILVFGATGPSGTEFCSAALEQGHQLSLFVRNPQKLPLELSGNPNVTVIHGTFEDVTKMEQAVGCGARIFVPFAGPIYGSKGTPVTEAIKLIFPMLVANNYKRAMVLGTCSYPSPRDIGGIKWKLSVALIKIIGGSVYEEFRGLGEFVASQDATQLQWTLFRAPFLTNGAEAPVTATHTGHDDDSFFLSRKSMASWVLKEMDTNSVQVGKTPVISN
ncbi:hypothetical protein BDV41DRAFT_307527 [Aspergillus transmontanensis]|uniref:NAD(P)-binding domain-containing protein n=1 Tax=Aspergillus transmontanensis TaxID=1034304 RepID=A0A5N6VUC9_9EURO|nr:hypothetical protein BDV41DRAFT_307527 [Aspergillus transmontanensis]